MRVAAVARPVAERARVRGGGVAELAAEALDQIRTFPRHLPPVRDGGVAGANWGGEPLEKAFVGRVGVGRQHRHDVGAELLPGEFPGQPVVELPARHDEDLGPEAARFLNRAVARGGVHDENPRPQR